MVKQFVGVKETANSQHRQHLTVRGTQVVLKLRELGTVGDVVVLTTMPMRAKSEDTQTLIPITRLSGLIVPRAKHGQPKARMRVL